MSASREQIIEALRDVFDPELGMSVVDLGLIYGDGPKHAQSSGILELPGPPPMSAPSRAPVSSM